MIRVLFVCRGNYCRSPMAEAVFRKMVSDAGLSGEIMADSCGTDGWNAGGRPHKETLRLLAEKGVPCDDLYGSKLKRGHLNEFDYIIPMDEGNLRDILALKRGECKAEIRLLSHYQKDSWIYVPDPWITGNFRLAYELIDAGCGGLLSHIAEKQEFVTKS